jgi:hypothetical protein
MPTATDLVTDLPADFEVFGQAVATSMADLLGGTAGQILAKNSNTDMDFVWIANDQGDITGITATSPLTGGGTSGAVTVGIQDGTTAQKGAVQLENSTSSTSTTTAAVPAAVKSAYDLADGAIAKTTVTTAGDIIYRNATVPTRLAIGTAGQVLAVNSGATAPEWIAAPGVGTWSSAASGSFTGSSVVISSLTGREFMIQVNGLSTGGDNTPLLRFNGDSGQNYGRQNLQDGFNDGMTLGRTGSAGAALQGMVYIPNASETTMWKYAIGGRNGEVYGGFYKGTSAITSITIDGNGGTFDAGTYTIWKRG